MKRTVQLTAALMSLGLIFSATAQGADRHVGSGGFALHIDDVSGLDAPWPLQVGLPFAEGALTDVANVRIVSGETEVFAQIDPAMTWRDGSVRWALAGFRAPPNEAYRVEYGPEVRRTDSAARIQISQAADGHLRVQTGAAVYDFPPDALLPAQVAVDGIRVLDGAGDGAYLVDNLGREGRIAGPEAQVRTQIVRAGPARVVVLRRGFYVTAQGERLARARIWFYFTADCPNLRMTHSLVLTEPTPEVWARDYGLTFPTPGPPSRTRFALGPPGTETLFEVASTEAETFLLQETFPHFLSLESRALVGRVGADGEMTILNESDMAGDWADALYTDYGLTLVRPWMAQQFPAELAFSPAGARVAFWSGRSGREMDFRAETLVREYWGEWAERLVENADSNVIPWINRYWTEDREPEGAEALACWPSNAQGAARTQDLWLLFRATGVSTSTLHARARAAARPPQVLAEPAHLCATEAIGWPMHPKDASRFPEAEAMMVDYWEGLTAPLDRLPHTGLIAWGAFPPLSTGKLFRHGILVDYGLRRHVWGLYARSGERPYREYGARFNRHIADWWTSHWDAGDKFRGGFASPGGYWEGHMPFPWGDRSELSGDSSGHDVHNWLLEHVLTGDEYALHLHRMVEDAHRQHWDEEWVRTAPIGRGGIQRWHIPMPLRVLASLYNREWDADLGRWTRELAARLIDLDNPVGITDRFSGGALYKWERNVHALYDYYRATGDETARTAILRALDYFYRFDMVSAPFGHTNHAAFLYTIAYRWTGREGYLRLVRSLVERSLATQRLPSGIHTNAHPTMGLPAALELLAEGADDPRPFPLLDFVQTSEPRAVRIEKPAGQSVTLSIFVRLPEGADAATPLAVALHRRTDSGSAPTQPESLEIESLFQTAGLRYDPKLRHVRVTLPATAPAGDYNVTLPEAEQVRVLETEPPQIPLKLHPEP